jgi:hypothetical protein
LPLLEEVVTNQRTETAYDTVGREASYTEQTISNAAPDLITTVARNGITYDNNNRISAYTDTTVQQGNAQSLNITTIDSRSNILYDTSGNQLTYHETITDPAGVTTKDWTTQAYNGFGQLTGWTENGTGPLGAFSKTQSHITYDNQGRQNAYQEQGTSDNAGSYSKTWTQAQYNRLGQLSAYEETGSLAGQPSYSKTWTAQDANAYNLYGQQNRYQEVLTQDYGTGVIGQTKTTEREWKNAVYNSLGQLQHYTEISLLTAPQVQNEKTWDAKAYDEQGRVTHYEEDTIIHYYDPYLNNTTAKPLYTETQSKVWKNAVYDDRGLVKQFEETTKKKVDSEQWTVDSESQSPLLITDHWSQVTRKDTTYNPFGHLLSYNETGSSSANGSYTRSWVALALDNLGRATEYHETGTSQSNGITDYVRSNITYDANGFITSYHDEGMIGNQFVRKDWGSPVYDVLGRLHSYAESGWTENGRYEKIQNNMTYNLLGQTLAYNETGWNAQQGSYTKTWNNGVYDLRENITSYHSEVTDGFGKKTISDWTANGYDAFGRLLGYKETGQEFDLSLPISQISNPTSVFETTWTADFSDSYTDLGQQNHFRSITTRTTNDLIETEENETAATTTTREWSHASYNEQGRLIGYRDRTETNRQTSDGSQQAVSEIVRSDIRYYTKEDEQQDPSHVWGTLAGYQEQAIGSNADQKPSQTIVDQVSYDTDGRMLGNLSVTADNELISSILRQFSDWLNALETFTLPLYHFTTLSLQLASLLGFKPAVLQSAKDWMSIKIPALSEEDRSAFNTFLDDLAVLLTQPASAVEDLIQKVRAAIPNLSLAMTALKDTIAVEFAQAFENLTKLPTVTDANTAYAKLHPFDYSATVTKKTGTQFDERNRPISWTETTYSSSAPEKRTDSEIQVTYIGNTQRQATYEAHIHETGQDQAGNALDKVTHLFRSHFTYNTFDQATAYTETTFEGDVLTADLGFGMWDVSNGTDQSDGSSLPISQISYPISITWSSLSTAAKQQLIQALIAETVEVKEIVNIAQYQNVTYNAANQMTDYDLTTYRRGYTYQAFSELASVQKPLEQLSQMIQLQSGQIAEIQKETEELQQAWLETYEKVKTELGVNLPDPSNFQAVIDAVSQELQTRYQTEADKELITETALTDLEAKVAALNTISAKVLENQQTLTNARNNWKDAVTAMSQFIAQLLGNESTIAGEITELKTIANTLNNFQTEVQTLESSYGSFVTAMKGWEPKSEAALSDAEEWDTTLNMTLERSETLADWKPDTAVNALLTQAEDIQGKLNALVEVLEGDDNLENPKIGLITIIENAINTPETGYQAVRDAKATAKSEAQTTYDTANTNYQTQEAEVERLQTLYDTAKTQEENYWNTYIQPLKDRIAYLQNIDIPSLLRQISESNGWVLANTPAIQSWRPYRGRIRMNIQVSGGGNSVTITNTTTNMYGTTSTNSSTIPWDQMQNSINNFAADSWDIVMAIYRVAGGYAPHDFAYNTISPILSNWLRGEWPYGGGDIIANAYRDFLNNNFSGIKNFWNLHINYNNAVGEVSSKQERINQLTPTYNTYQSQTKTALDQLTAAQKILGTDPADPDYSVSYKAILDNAQAKLDSAEEALETAQDQLDSAEDALTNVNSLKIVFKGYQQTLTDKIGTDKIGTSESLSGLRPLTTAFKNAVSTLKTNVTSWTTAFTNKENSQTIFDRKAGELATARQARQKADTSLSALNARLESRTQAQANLAVEQENLSRIQQNYQDTEERTRQLLTGRTFRIGQADYSLTTENASALIRGESIQLGDQSYTLSDLAQNDQVQVKVNASEVRTSARRNITYNGRGLTAQYEEIAFTGTEVSVNGETKNWNSLSMQEKSGIFEHTIKAEISGSGTLTIQEALSHEYDHSGKTYRQVIKTIETSYEMGQPVTHSYETIMENMTYDALGNLLRYKKTTTEEDQPTSGLGAGDLGLEKGKVVTEETLEDNQYDTKGRLIYSHLSITERVPAIANPQSPPPNPDVYNKTYEIITKTESYNELDQAQRITRIIEEGDRVTIETTIADNQYDGQGHLSYSKQKIVETTKDALGSELWDLSFQSSDSLNQLIAQSSQLNAKESIVESWGHRYNARGQLLHSIKLTQEQGKTIQEETDYEYDVTGKISRTLSQLTETAAPSLTTSLYYRFQKIETFGFKYNSAGQILRQTRRTIMDDKETIEESLDDMTYDRAGRLTHSRNRITETTGVGDLGLGVSQDLNQTLIPNTQSHSYEVSLDIHSYDSKDRILRQTKTTLDDGKRVVESNLNTEDFQYDDQDHLIRQVLDITENSVDTTGTITQDYAKNYRQTQTFTQYDEAGQLLKSTRETRSTDLTGKTMIVEENSAYAYNVRGQVVENAIVRTSYSLDSSGNESAKKITTSVTLVPPSGFNSRGQMIHFVTFNFEGSTIKVLRDLGLGDGDWQTTEVSWNELTIEEKKGFLSGSIKDRLQSTLLVTQMTGVNYNAKGLMDSYLAKTMVMGLADFELETILRSTFKGLVLQEYERAANLAAFNELFGKGTLLFSDGSSLAVMQLTDEEKLALMASASSSNPITLRGIALSEIKIRLSLDHTALTLRTRTAYNALSQISGYDEVSLDRANWMLNGRVTTLDPAGVNQLLQTWERLQNAETVSAEDAKLIPNTFTTWTHMSEMRYSKSGQAVSWETRRQELQMKLTDLNNPFQDGTIRLAVNRVSTNRREETVYRPRENDDPSIPQQELAIRETNIGPNGEQSSSWIFFNYDDQDRATDVLRISKETIGGDSSAGGAEELWSAEITHVDSFKSVRNRDLYERTRVTRALNIQISDELKNMSSGTQALEKFVLQDHVTFAEQQTAAYTTLQNSRISTDITDFVYDETLAEPLITQTIVSRTSADNLKSVEKTEYFYSAEGDKKPSHTRTTYVYNPAFDDQGVWIPQTNDLKTIEDAVLTYDTRGILKHSEVVRVDPSGIQTAEQTDFTYQLGRVVKTSKTMIANYANDQTSRSDQLAVNLPGDFRIYAGGGQVTKEETAFTYQGRHMTESQVFTIKPLGNTTFERNQFEYDDYDRIKKSINTTYEGVPSSDTAPENGSYPRTTTIRENFQYLDSGPAAGQPLSYTETINTSIAPEKFTVRQVSDIRYDVQRRLISSIAVEQDFLKAGVGDLGLGVSNDITPLGSQRTIITKAGIDFANPQPLAPNPAVEGYDQFGRLANLTRTTLDHGIQTTERISHEFSVADGRVIGSTLLTHQTDLETSGALLNREYEEVLTYDQYHLDYNRVIAQTRKVYEGDKVTIEMTRNTYDSQGRTAIVESARTEAGLAGNRNEYVFNHERSLDYHILNRSINTITQASGFNLIGQMTGYTRTTMEQGRQTVETVSDVIYDSYGQMLSNHTEVAEKDLETNGQKFSTAYAMDLEQTYDALGRVIDYTKTITQSNENRRTIETVSNLQYDAQNRLLHQESSFIEEDTLQDTTESSVVFHKEYTIITDYTLYNTLGQAQAWTRTTIEGDKQTIEDTVAVYNAEGRIASTQSNITEKSQTLTSDVLNHSYSVITFNTYNNLGQIYSTQRTTTDGDKITVENSHELIYDKQGRLTTSTYEISELDKEYYEKVVIPAVAVGDPLPSAGIQPLLNHTRTVTTSNTFDNLGRISSTLRTTVDKGGLHTTTEKITDLNYLQDGQLSGSTAEITETSPGFIQKSIVITENMTYNGLNQATGYKRMTKTLGLGAGDWGLVKKQTVETASNLTYDAQGRSKTSDVIISEQWTVNGEQQTISLRHVHTENLSYNSLGQVTRTHRITDVMPLPTSQISSLSPTPIGDPTSPLKTITETSLADSTYDFNGRLFFSHTQYHEYALPLTLDVGTSDLSADGVVADAVAILDHTYSIKTENLSYNTAGLMTAYVRTTQDNAKMTQETVKEGGIIYDSNGRILFQFSEIHETGSTEGSILDHRYRQYVQNETYDALDRVTQSRQTIFDGAKMTAIQTNNMTYDLEGHLLTYERTTRESDRVTIETTLENNQYNALGWLLKSHVQVLEKSADPSAGEAITFRTQQIITENTKFDTQGRVLQYTRTTNDLTAFMVNSPQSIVKTTVETTLSDNEYNALGQLTKSTVQFHEVGYGEPLPFTTSTTFTTFTTLLDRTFSVSTTNTAFNIQGLVSRYTRTTLENQRTTVETTLEDNVYDANGRLFASHLSITETAPGLNHTYETLISNTLYNNLGQIISQHRERRDFEKSTEEIVTDFTYDSLGRLTGSKSSVTETAEYGLNHTYDNETQILKYNDLGQALMTKNTISNDSGALARVVESTRYAMQYNIQGQLIEYSEDQYSNAAPNRLVTTTRTNIQYNDAGQMISWLEVQRVQPPSGDAENAAILASTEIKEQDLYTYTDQNGNPIISMTLEEYLASITAENSGENLYTLFHDLITQAVKNALPDMSADWIEKAVNAVLSSVTDQKDNGPGFSILSLTPGNILLSILSSYFNSAKVQAIVDGEQQEKATAGFNIGQIVDNDLQSDGESLKDLTLRQVLKNILVQAFESYHFTTFTTSTTPLDVIADTLINSITSLADYLDTKLLDIPEFFPTETSDSQVQGSPALNPSEEPLPITDTYGDSLRNTSLGQLIYNALFRDITSETITLLFTQVLQGSLAGYQMADGTALGQASFGQMLLHLLAPTEPLTLDVARRTSDAITSILAAKFTNYAGRLDSTSKVTSVQYDSLSRMTSKSEERHWTELGGGSIAGLDSGWKNGTVSLTQSFQYEGNRDRLSAQSVRASGSGAHNDFGTSIDHRYVESNIEYDNHGRQVGSWSLGVAPVKYQYWWYDEDKGWFGGGYQEHAVNDVKVNSVATLSHSRTTSFDSLGRALSTESEYWREDSNATHGKSIETNIVYNGDGQKTSSTTDGTSYAELRNESGYEPGHATQVGDITGDLQTYTNSGSLLGLAGELSSGFKTRMDTWVSQQHDGNNYSKAFRTTGTNNYRYDAYGNVDEEATKNASNLKTDTQPAGEDAGWMEPVTILVQVAAVAASIAAGIVTGGAAFAAMGLLMQAISLVTFAAIEASLVALSMGINGVDKDQIFRQSAIAFGTSFLSNATTAALKGMATSARAGNAGKLVQFLNKHSQLIRTTVNVGIRTGATAISGVRGDEIWKTAASSAIASVANFLPNGADRLVNKMLITAGLNAAAANIQGVKDGKQLLTIALISAAGTLANSLTTPSQSNASNNSSYKGITGNAIWDNFMSAILGEVVRSVISNNIKGLEGQGISMVLSQVVSNVMTLQRDTESRRNDILKQEGVSDAEKNRQLDQLLEGNDWGRIQGKMSELVGNLRHFGDRVLEGFRTEVQNFTSYSGSEGQRLEQERRSLEDQKRADNLYENALMNAYSGFTSALQNMMGFSGNRSQRYGISTLSFGRGKETELQNTGMENGNGWSQSSSNPNSDQRTGASSTWTGERDSGDYLMLSQRTGKMEGNLSQKEIESVLSSMKDIKVLEAQVLEKEFGNTLGMAKDKLIAAGLMSKEAQMVGVEINNQKFALFIEKGEIRGALYKNASGQNELKSFTKFEYEGGKVVKAEGKIYREIGGQLKEVGEFRYLAGNQAKQAIETFVKGNVSKEAEGIAQALSKANQVYQEITKDSQGKEHNSRTVFLGEDKNGSAMILASEHANYDSSGKLSGYTLRTYDYMSHPSPLARTGELGEGGGEGNILAQGKVYTRTLESGSQYAKASAEFVIAKMGGNALQKLGNLTGQIAQQLGLGGNVSLLVYNEVNLQTGQLNKGIVLDEQTGALKYIVDKTKDGMVITVFSASEKQALKNAIAKGALKDVIPAPDRSRGQAPAGIHGVDVRLFSDISEQQQSEILASLPAMSKHDNAITTQKIVAMQTQLAASMAQKALKAAGFELDGVKLGDNTFLPVPIAVARLMAKFLGISEEAVANMTFNLTDLKTIEGKGIVIEGTVGIGLNGKDRKSVNIFSGQMVKGMVSDPSVIKDGTSVMAFKDKQGNILNAVAYTPNRDIEDGYEVTAITIDANKLSSLLSGAKSIEGYFAKPTAVEKTAETGSKAIEKLAPGAKETIKKLQHGEKLNDKKLEQQLQENLKDPMPAPLKPMLMPMMKVQDRVEKAAQYAFNVLGNDAYDFEVVNNDAYEKYVSEKNGSIAQIQGNTQTEEKIDVQKSTTENILPNFNLSEQISQKLGWRNLADLFVTGTSVLGITHEQGIASLRESLMSLIPMASAFGAEIRSIWKITYLTVMGQIESQTKDREEFRKEVMTAFTGVAKELQVAEKKWKENQIKVRDPLSVKEHEILRTKAQGLAAYKENLFTVQKLIQKGDWAQAWDLYQGGKEARIESQKAEVRLQLDAIEIHAKQIHEKLQQGSFGTHLYEKTENLLAEIVSAREALKGGELFDRDGKGGSIWKALQLASQFNFSSASSEIAKSMGFDKNKGLAGSLVSNIEDLTDKSLKFMLNLPGMDSARKTLETDIQQRHKALEFRMNELEAAVGMVADGQTALREGHTAESSLIRGQAALAAGRTYISGGKSSMDGMKDQLVSLIQQGNPWAVKTLSRSVGVFKGFNDGIQGLTAIVHGNRTATWENYNASVQQLENAQVQGIRLEKETDGIAKWQGSRTRLDGLIGTAFTYLFANGRELDRGMEAWLSDANKGLQPDLKKMDDFSEALDLRMEIGWETIKFGVSAVSAGISVVSAARALTGTLGGKVTWTVAMKALGRETLEYTVGGGGMMAAIENGKSLLFEGKWLGWHKTFEAGVEGMQMAPMFKVFGVHTNLVNRPSDITGLNTLAEQASVKVFGNGVGKWVGGSLVNGIKIGEDLVSFSIIQPVSAPVIGFTLKTANQSLGNPLREDQISEMTEVGSFAMGFILPFKAHSTKRPPVSEWKNLKSLDTVTEIQIGKEVRETGNIILGQKNGKVYIEITQQGAEHLTAEKMTQWKQKSYDYGKEIHWVIKDAQAVKTLKPETIKYLDSREVNFVLDLKINEKSNFIAVKTKNITEAEKLVEVYNQEGKVKDYGFIRKIEELSGRRFPGSEDPASGGAARSREIGTHPDGGIPQNVLRDGPQRPGPANRANPETPGIQEPVPQKNNGPMEEGIQPPTISNDGGTGGKGVNPPQPPTVDGVNNGSGKGDTIPPPKDNAGDRGQNLNDPAKPKESNGVLSAGPSNPTLVSRIQKGISKIVSWLEGKIQNRQAKLESDSAGDTGQGGVASLRRNFINRIKSIRRKEQTKYDQEQTKYDQEQTKYDQEQTKYDQEQTKNRASRFAAEAIRGMREEVRLAQQELCELRAAKRHFNERTSTDRERIAGTGSGSDEIGARAGRYGIIKIHVEDITQPQNASTIHNLIRTDLETYRAETRQTLLKKVTPLAERIRSENYNPANVRTLLVELGSHVIKKYDLLLIIEKPKLGAFKLITEGRAIGKPMNIKVKSGDNGLISYESAMDWAIKEYGSKQAAENFFRKNGYQSKEFEGNNYLADHQGKLLASDIDPVYLRSAGNGMETVVIRNEQGEYTTGPGQMAIKDFNSLVGESFGLGKDGVKIIQNDASFNVENPEGQLRDILLNKGIPYDKGILAFGNDGKVFDLKEKGTVKAFLELYKTPVPEWVSELEGPAVSQEKLPQSQLNIGTNISENGPPQVETIRQGSSTPVIKRFPQKVVDLFRYGSLKVERSPLDRILSNPKDEFTIDGGSDEAITKHLRHIEDHGTIEKPILVRRLWNNYEIVDGHHRWTAAKKFGLETVPVIIDQKTSLPKDPAKVDQWPSNAGATTLPTIVAEKIIQLTQTIKNTLRSENPTTNSIESSASSLKGQWDKSTFQNETQSIQYHWGKHARGLGKSMEEYTKDATEFFQKNKSIGQEVTLKDGSKGLLIKIGKRNPGGYFKEDGKIVTFWYK